MYNTTTKAPHLPDDDAVLHREAISGQASDVPGSDGHLVTQSLDEGELTGAGNALDIDTADPQFDLVLPEG